MKTLGNSRDAEEILSRLQRVRPTSPRLWGKMTAPEMICHVRDGFKLYLGLITVACPGFPYPSKLLKWGSLWVPIRWPKGFKTPAEIDQHRDAVRPGDFDSDVAELRSLVSRFAGNPPKFDWPHPYLGRMSTSEWMRLGYLHSDHHLRQFGV